MPLIFTLFACLFLIVASFTLPAIASPYIVSDLGGDRTLTNYVLAFFGFGTAISIPLARPLGARFGVAKMFIATVLAFGATNLLCALAPTYFAFIGARLLSGFASGPFYPIWAYFFSRTVTGEKKIVIFWVFITTLIVVPVVGACWGGTIAYLYHWSFPFFLNAALSLPLAALLYFNFQEIEDQPYEKKFDWIGWGFYAFGVFCLTFAIATAQQLDWYRSPILVASVIAGLTSFCYYLLRSFNHESPVMDLSLFKKPIFSLALLSLVVLFSVYFGMILLLSIWLTLDVRFTPVWIAVLIGHMGIAGLLPRFIIEERLGKIDPRIWLILASLLLAGSCFYTTLFSTDIDIGRIAISRIVAGFGLALFLPPIFQIISQCYSPTRWMDVFELFQSVRNLACGIGASVFSILWERRTVFYHERLNEKLSPQSNAVSTFFRKAETLYVPGDPAAQLNTYLDRTASSLALDDVFYLMGWLLLALLFLLLLTFLFKPDAFNICKAKYCPPPESDKTDLT